MYQVLKLGGGFQLCFLCSPQKLVKWSVVWLAHIFLIIFQMGWWKKHQLESAHFFHFPTIRRPGISAATVMISPVACQTLIMGISYQPLWIQVPPKKILQPPNCTLLSAFQAATWIHREQLLNSLSSPDIFQAEGKLQAAAHAQTAAVEELANRLDQLGHRIGWKVEEG